MENELLNGEQPEALSVQNAIDDKNKGTKESEGSPIGKFKSAETLLDAYNELQAEFTRKCQKLSEAEKKLQDVSFQNKTGVNDETIKNEFAWKNNINEFLQSHEKAGGLVEEITNEIINDESLKFSDNGLEKAYARVIEKLYVPSSQLAKDEKFLNNYIFNDEEIKNKIIKEYISGLQKGQSPIQVCSSGFSGSVANKNNFTTLSEANKYVENMFRF